MIEILQLEDNRFDAELLNATLTAEGIKCRVRCVQTRKEFETALEHGSFDLIISDNALPNYDGLSALGFAKTKAPQTPFIFVSGTIKEEVAIESLRRGATDYVLKDRPGRLVSAVRRALCEAKEQAEKRKLEAQFYRVQRLESIGALAGGIAHDLNNVLTPILIAAQFLEQATEAKERAEMVATITSCAQRGSEMVKRILSFARGTVGHSDRLHMEELCAEMARLAQATFPRDIRVFSKSVVPLPPVLGNTTQLHQVLMNLCVNARDAMPDGGTLTISTEAISLENHSIKSELEPVSGNYVVLSVADTGAGIPAEMLDQVFEPFFTTKEQGKGTGLGLPTVLGIVKNHGGFVEVLSESGQGTTFKVYLPIASAVHPSKP